jgi:hypothetical protein
MKFDLHSTPTRRHDSQVDVALSAVRRLVVVGAASRLHPTRENVPGKSPVCW